MNVSKQSNYFCFLDEYTPYDTYTFNNDDTLKEDIKEACNLFNDIYVVDVFSRDKDEVNVILNSNGRFLFEYKNLSYYVVDNVEFIDKIDFETLRHMCIYMMENEPVDYKMLMSEYIAVIGLENFLEYTELRIKKSKHNEKSKLIGITKT